MLQTIVQQIGHNLNMAHDFNCPKTRVNQPNCERKCAKNREHSCTDVMSIMDYFQVLFMV